jgi:hypothetical protein
MHESDPALIIQAFNEYSRHLNAALETFYPDQLLALAQVTGCSSEMCDQIIQQIAHRPA